LKDDKIKKKQQNYMNIVRLDHRLDILHESVKNYREILHPVFGI